MTVPYYRRSIDPVNQYRRWIDRRVRTLRPAEVTAYYPGNEDPHEPDTSPKRQRVDCRGDNPRSTRWRFGLVCDHLPHRRNISASVVGGNCHRTEMASWCIKSLPERW